MASPQDKNSRRVPLLDHEKHGSLAPRNPARMPGIACTIQPKHVFSQLNITYETPTIMGTFTVRMRISLVPQFESGRSSVP